MKDRRQSANNKSRDLANDSFRFVDEPWASVGDDERLEFMLSQYIDGDLSGEARADFERQLAADGKLAGRLAAYRRLDSVVRRSVGDVPELDWDRFAMQAADRREAHDAARRIRIIYRLFAPLAAAAAVIAFAVFWTGSTATDGTDGDRTGPLQVARVGKIDGQELATVEVERALPWQMTDEATTTVAKVSFGRTVPPGFSSPGADEMIVSSIVVASAGITSADGHMSDERTLPYF